MNFIFNLNLLYALFLHHLSEHVPQCNLYTLLCIFIHILLATQLKTVRLFEDFSCFSSFQYNPSMVDFSWLSYLHKFLTLSL